MGTRTACGRRCTSATTRSEEHTSELQSHSDLVCRLLLEKKNPREAGWLPPAHACSAWPCSLRAAASSRGLCLPAGDSLGSLARCPPDADGDRAGRRPQDV